MCVCVCVLVGYEDPIRLSLRKTLFKGHMSESIYSRMG